MIGEGDCTLDTVPQWLLRAFSLCVPAPLYMCGYPHLHGIFMGIAWGICVPIGAGIARDARKADPLWFKLHLGLQVTGVSLSLIGFVVVFVGGASNPNFAHGTIGIGMGRGEHPACPASQGINGAIRPHKSKRFRTQWEWLHKGSGWIAIVLGIVNVSLGCFLVVGPDAVWIAW
eukprot:353839-Chlamydomonas_euryale.AAC.48